MTLTDPKTGRVILKYDYIIDKAAREGDNDAALEFSIWQKQFMEMYCSNPEELQEWERRVNG